MLFPKGDLTIGKTKHCLIRKTRSTISYSTSISSCPRGFELSQLPLFAAQETWTWTKFTLRNDHGYAGPRTKDYVPHIKQEHNHR